MKVKKKKIRKLHPFECAVPRHELQGTFTFLSFSRSLERFYDFFSPLFSLPNNSDEQKNKKILFLRTFE